MANEIRLRRNNISGTITDNPLSNVATTINSPGFVDLPTVDATNHLILILDPTEVNGPAEIVRVTAHTAAASSVTVTRGAEGSAARSHILGTTWFHGPVAGDTTLSDVTSSTRPSVPYEGELIYETDTNKFVGFGGTDWAPRDAGGQIGYAQVTASQSGITAETALTSLTLTLTPGTGRRIKITGVGRFQSTIADDTFELRLKKDGSQVQASQGLCRPANSDIPLSVTFIESPTAVSHTYNLFLARVTGTGSGTLTAAGVAPAFILIEDIGAA